MGDKTKSDHDAILYVKNSLKFDRGEQDFILRPNRTSESWTKLATIVLVAGFVRLLEFISLSFLS